MIKGAQGSEMRAGATCRHIEGRLALQQDLHLIRIPLLNRFQQLNVLLKNRQINQGAAQTLSAP
jgi:hypothetical protein